MAARVATKVAQQWKASLLPDIVVGHATLKPPFALAPGKSEAALVAALVDFARRTGNTAYHLVGTCRMAPESDPTSVVDHELRVRGVEGLRVADASIMPIVPSANTMAASLVIGEKAADLILGRPVTDSRGASAP